MSSFSRRHLLRAAPFAGGLGLWPSASSAALQGAVKPPENFRTLGAPVVQCASPTAVTVAWSVNDTSTGWVEYGETEALGQVALPDGQGLHPLDAVVHKVRIEGLRPGTRYHYRTVSIPIAFLGPYDIRRGRPFESGSYHFTTSDGGAGERVRFAVINDTHEQRETVRAVFGRLAETPADLLFWNGDMFDDIGSERQMAEQLLYPADVAYATTVPVYFARGNHDVRGVQARALSRFIETPGGRYYYVIRQGPVAFVVVDTGEDKPDDHPAYAGLGSFDGYRATQAAWLADVFQQEAVRTAPFRVVIAHIPLYSDRPTQAHGGADARAKWHDLLVRGQVDLLVTGHTHRYAYMPPDANRPFGQLTGGGPRLEAATVIEADASSQRLTVVMRTLDGAVVGEYVVPRRS